MLKLENLLSKAHAIADHPGEAFREALKQGQRVVGVAPGYTPEPLIHAMGCLPFGVWGADIQVEAAKAYFPAFIPSLLQTMLELGIRGTYDGMTALVIPSLSDSLKALGQNWKYAVQSIPFIPMTYPQNRSTPAGQAFTRAGCERVAQDLEKLTGQPLKPEALLASIELYNRHRSLMQAFDEAAARVGLKPRDRLAVFKSAWFMSVTDHIDLLEPLIEALNQQPPTPQPLTRILTSGLLVDAPGLMEILESLDYCVVGDDVLAESRQYRVEIPVHPEDPLKGLAEQFAQMDHCSLLYDRDKKRGPLLIDLAKKRQAAGVVLFLTKFSDPEEFDYVPIKRALDEAGLPLLLIEVDRQMQRFDQAQTALETFKDLLEMSD